MTIGKPIKINLADAPRQRKTDHGAVGARSSVNGKTSLP
jgi:hypothetical protein